MASFSSTAFDTDAFSESSYEFDGAAPVVVVVDTHDGARKRKEWQARIDARNRLRGQIKEAGGWPDPMADAIEEVLEPFAKPQLADSAPIPLVDRIDWNELKVSVLEIEQEIAAARQRAEDEDDDDALLLLS